MAKYTITIILLTLMVGCSHQPLKWSKKEKVMVGTLLLLQGMDAYQSHTATTSKDYKEGNPLIRGVFGEEVTWKEATLGKTVVLLPLLYGVHRIPKTHTTREAMLFILNGISFSVVVVNEYTTGGIILKGDF